MEIRKSGCIELDRTCCYTGKFNTALSLYRVLEITLYFSEGFLEAVAEALQPLGVIMVCFLGQEFNLWSSVLQKRYRLFLRYFLHLSLVNLPLLASLEKRSTHKEFDCFLEAEDRDSLKEDILVDEVTKDGFTLF